MADPVSFAAFDFIRFTWSDIHGVPKGKLIPAEKAAEFVADGIHVYAGNMLGPCSSEALPETFHKAHGNGVARAIPGTLTSLPWVGQSCEESKVNRHWRVGNILCEFHLTSCEQYDICTRRIARRQLQKLHEEFGYRLKSGQEHEFVILQSGSAQPPSDGWDLLSHAVHSKYENLLYLISDNLSKCCVKVESMLAESGAGQFEMATSPMMGIETADASFMLKQVVNEVSRQHGYFSTFMTVPYNGVFNTTHFNHSLLNDEGANVFHDENGAHKMSSAFQHWTAGVLAHAQALTALCCPSINCYRRSGMNMLPEKSDWGIDNRRSLLRVKNHGSYLENRLPTAASNVYLVMAATVAAGLDGLRRKLELPAEMDYDAQELPETLEEALDALKKDDILKGSLGDNFVECFVQYKMKVEAKSLKPNGGTIFEQE